MTTGSVSLALVLVVLAACRFGGPSGNPAEYVTYPSDAESPDAPGPSSSGGGQGGQVGGGGDDATVGTTADAADHRTTGDDASIRDDASFGDDASGGCRPTVAVCNPVRNTGCNALQQCDVDTTQKTMPTGVCVFNSGSEGSASCSASIFTESCRPQSTCVNGGCRSLCFCKSDCPAGQCCSGTNGPAGFSLCEPCP